MHIIRTHGNVSYVHTTLGFRYRISSINNASSISTAVWYYSNTNNIEFNVYFNGNAPSNNTA